MSRLMAYGRLLAAAAWVVAAGACGDDSGDGGAQDGGRVERDAGEAATEMYVGPAGIGQEDNPAFDGLSEAFPIDTLTRALELRLRERKYRSVTDIVLLTGEYARNERFPIEVRRPQSVERLTIRGGATARDRAVIRNDRTQTPADQQTVPILDIFPGVTVENLTIENRYVADSCLGRLNTVILGGEAEAPQIVFDNVEIRGGSPCHTHIGIESNANVLFQGEVVIDGGNRAGGITTEVDGRSAANSVIEFRGNENRNCTGIRFLNMGPRLFDMGMPRNNTGNPAILMRGTNTAVFDQVCIRPGDSFGERTAAFIRGEAEVTFTGLEIQTSDGTVNGERFTYGIQHSPQAGVSGNTVIDGATIDVAGTGIALNGGVTTIDDVDFTQSEWAIERSRGDVRVRDCEFANNRSGGVLIDGTIARLVEGAWAYDTIDLGTEASPGNNTFRYQNQDGEQGDITIEVEGPGDEEPEFDLMIEALGQRAWSPTIRMDVVCRGAQQQDDFNIDVRVPGVRVEFRPVTEEEPMPWCEGYEPPSDAT